MRTLFTRSLLLIVLLSIGLTPHRESGAGEARSRLAPAASPDSRNVVQLGRWGGEWFHAVALQAAYAYVGVWSPDGLRLDVIDISDPAHPRKQGQNPILLGFVSDLVVRGNWAYATISGVGLQVIDISDPSHLLPIGIYRTQGTAMHLDIAGDYAYIADGAMGLVILNISNPARPTLAGTYSLRGVITNVMVQNNYAYISWGQCNHPVIDYSSPCGGLRIIDVTNVANPIEVGSYTTYGVGAEAIVSGQIVYLISMIYYDDPGDGCMCSDRIYYFHAINVSNPHSPVEVANSIVSYSQQGYSYGESAYVATAEIEILDNQAYLALAGVGAYRIDVSDPAHLPAESELPASGSSEDVEAIGDYIYVADGPQGLHVINVSDPINPIETARYDTPSFVRNVAVDENYLYLSVEDGFWTANILTPDVPLGFSAYPQGGRSQRLIVTGTHAFVSEAGSKSTTTSIVRVMDVSNPVSPTQAGSFDTPYMDTEDIVVTGTWAYLADGDGGLRILDITLPDYPREVGYFDTPGHAYEVAISGTLAYVADGNGGIQIINISDPTSPTRLSTFPTPGGASDVAIDGDYLYISEVETRRIHIVDVSNPLTPTEVSSFVALSYPDDILVVGGYLYVTGLQWITACDVSNPMSPACSFYFSGYHAFRELASDGNLLYVATSNGLQILSTNDPANFTLVGSFTTTSLAYIVVVGNYAYLADDYDMYVIDVSNPVSPTQVGLYHHEPDPFGFKTLAVTGTWAFLASEKSVDVVDISTPITPTWAAVYRRPADGYDMDMVGDYAYLAVGRDGLRVLDVSNPLRLAEAGYVALPGFARGVALAGNYAYVAVEEQGLQVVDVSTPTMPLVVGTYDTPGSANDVAIVGTYAYVADGTSGLQIIDVSSPLTPTFKGNYDTDGSAGAIALAGDYAYIADGPGGLRVLYIGDPAYPIEVGFYNKGNVPDVTTANGNIYVADSGLAVLRRTAIATTTAPAIGGSLTYTDGQGLPTLLQIPPEALPLTTTLLYEPEQAGAHGTMAFAGHAFNLRAYQAGVEQPELVFGLPVTLKQSCSEVDIRTVIDEDQVVWQWWNNGAWTDASMTCSPPALYDRDPSLNMIRVGICRPGQFALFGPTHSQFWPSLWFSSP